MKTALVKGFRIHMMVHRKDLSVSECFGTWGWIQEKMSLGLIWWLRRPRNLFYSFGLRLSQRNPSPISLGSCFVFIVSLVS